MTQQELADAAVMTRSHIAHIEGVSTGKVHDAPALVERMRGAYDLALGDALPLQKSLALTRRPASFSKNKPDSRCHRTRRVNPRACGHRLRTLLPGLGRRPRGAETHP